MASSRLIRIHIVPVNVVHGWLVSSRDKRWDWNDSMYCTTKSGAIAYARELAGTGWYQPGLSIRVHGRNGRIQSEFTLPRSADPQRSRG